MIKSKSSARKFCLTSLISLTMVWTLSIYGLFFTRSSNFDFVKKCNSQLEKKIPNHTKKTLQKKYFYAYYHHCPACKTNYMLEEAKRDIKELKL